MKKIKSFSLASLMALGTGLALNTQAAPGVQQVQQKASSDYAQTRYPILFTHGMFGFTRLGTATFGMDYWYQILPDLARNGAHVFAAQVSPLEATELRGEQLLAQVEEVLAITGKEKVNLIGHSHGGPTIRYIEAVAPEKVASLTAVGGTIKGSKIADDILANRMANGALTLFGEKLIAPIISLMQNNKDLPNSLNASLSSISEQGSADFNQRYPSAAIPQSACGQGQKVTANGIYHYSWTGTAQMTNALDVIDSAISILAPLSYKNLDNDGLVNRCNAHYGAVIRDDYRLNHLDEVNMVLGLRALFSPDPVALYRQHANRLKLEGL